MYLSGDYRHKLPDNGRLTLPAALRKDISKECPEGELPDTLKVVLSIEGDSLWVFREEEFDAWVQSFFADRDKPLSRDKKALELRRALTSRGKNVDLDKAGRFGIPADQRREAELGNDVVLLGVDDHFEIWNAKRWDEYKVTIDLTSLAYS
ncbi:MAG: hypothetical protein LBG81_05195 [Coriobacteriaceae bacterium]|nr:hypothetical protein [Coriobacteriaceae bacterium]